MHCAICWNCLLSTISTLDVSRHRLLSYKERVGAQSAGNQRQYSTSLVGTSETTRAAPYSKAFCEWLSGVIDGDGCLLVSKQGYASLEITVGSQDLPLLQFIKTKLGGSIKMRSNAKAYRYRLHHKDGMLKLLSCINGSIRHSTRLHQLHRVCTLLQVPCKKPSTLTKDSHWFAGFFDADGTIVLRQTGVAKRLVASDPGGRSLRNDGVASGFATTALPPSVQLTIRVTNKLIQDVQYYQDVFGGSIYYDTSQNGYYSWSIQSREHILDFLAYFQSHPFRSQKAKRFFLIHDYYLLRDRKAYLITSPHYKEWILFVDRWSERQAA